MVLKLELEKKLMYFQTKNIFKKHITQQNQTCIVENLFGF